MPVVGGIPAILEALESMVLHGEMPNHEAADMLQLLDELKTELEVRGINTREEVKS